MRARGLVGVGLLGVLAAEGRIAPWAPPQQTSDINLKQQSIEAMAQWWLRCPKERPTGTPAASTAV